MRCHCVVFMKFLIHFFNGVGDVRSRWRHFWFTSQHQSDLKYITHHSGSHYCFYYRSHQHTRTRNKNIYIAIKDYPEIRVWSYLPPVAHSFWERPMSLYSKMQSAPSLFLILCTRLFFYFIKLKWLRENCCLSCTQSGCSMKGGNINVTFLLRFENQTSSPLLPYL